MASDRDMISTEPHELNYVLKVWKKRATQSNRDILIEKLKDFKDDPAWKPHNRENFYRYADKKGIKALLEDALPSGSGDGDSENEEDLKLESSGSGRLNNASDDTVKRPVLEKSAGKEGKKNWIWLIILFIVIVILLILFFAFCNVCSPKASIETQVTTTLPENKDEQIATTTTVAALQRSPEEINSMIREFSTIYFEQNTADLLPGEQVKISRIAALLKDVPEIHFLVEGHCASIRLPDNEYRLSVQRAEKVKSLLENQMGQGRQYTIEGKGAKEPSGNRKVTAGHPDRRVEISAVDRN